MNRTVYRVWLFAREALFNSAAALNLGIASYRQPSRAGRLRHVVAAKRSREMLLTPIEADQIVALVRATAKLGGAMAEIGVYRGASARLIFEADGFRQLHLFDTFEGLPATGERDIGHQQGHFKKGQFACSLESVREYLGASARVSFHQGIFPSTAGEVSGQQFSFVHSDVDLHLGTRAVLEFFYPRMVTGGVIITHDFASASEVARAFTEFFADKPEPIIELPGDQGMVVKAASHGVTP